MPKLRHPDGHTVFATVAGAEVLRRRGYKDVARARPEPPERREPPARLPVPTEAPPKVGPGSGRDQWAAYAESLGVSVSDSMSRADLIAVVEARGG